VNFLDRILARIPFTEVTIKTSVSSFAVIERVGCGLQPALFMRQRSQFFTFEGSDQGNYFKIQGHLRNPDGQDAFPNKIYIGIAFIRIPLRIETSPTFYGRVFDDADGAIIRGHFAIPFPILALVIVLLLFLFGVVYPVWLKLSLWISLCLIAWSLVSLVEFITERQGILDFLKGLFADVIRTK